MALAAAVKTLWSFGGDGLSSASSPSKMSSPSAAGGGGGGGGGDKHERLAYNDHIAGMRAHEFPQLKDAIYLDHAGTTLPCRSLIDSFSQCLLSDLIANPHSASSASSQYASRKVDDIRLQVLQLFNASPDDFDLVFTANATAAIKLVGDCFRDATKEEGAECWYGYHQDAHTSLVGLRELLSRNIPAKCFGSDEEVGICLKTVSSASSALEHSDSTHRTPTLRLFAYPAQSNMDGRRLPLSWIPQARDAGIYTLLDAAALVSTAPLDLGKVDAAPDFTVVSFYKIFGFPDLGALIVRKSVRPIVEKRRYFGGGTVEIVSCLKEQWHVRKQTSIHEQMEDGTLPVHNIIALGCALDVHFKLFISMQNIALHTAFLADRLFYGLQGLKHGNGRPVCRIFGNRGTNPSGPVVAFNIVNSSGDWESNFEVEKLAAVRNVQLRTGGVCNPGGIASALQLSPWDLQTNFMAGQRCGGEDDIYSGKPTGVVRVSLGASSTIADVDAFLAFMLEYFVKPHTELEISAETTIPSYSSFHVESLAVFPIKSCAGWTIPHEIAWPIRSEGLAWDREWCLVHPGTRSVLSQKRHHRMALLRPKIDLDAGLLRVAYHGPLPPNVASDVVVPLSVDPSVFERTSASYDSNVCGDQVEMRTYASDEINKFFSTALDTPCVLARFPPSGTGPSARHAKPHLQTTSRIPRPLLLSNESPILIVSRSSLNRLNETIKGNDPPGMAAPAAVFRANVVIAEESSGFEQPFVEDLWTSMTISSRQSCRIVAHLDVLGPCRRCQMVCIDQSTGEKFTGGEPFGSLSKTRRRDGKVWFGVHSALSGKETFIQVGDQVEPRS